jgi:citrate lyase synthetase
MLTRSWKLRLRRHLSNGKTSLILLTNYPRDVNEDNVISADDIRSFLAKADVPYDDEEIQSMITTLDRNRNGSIEVTPPHVLKPLILLVF